MTCNYTSLLIGFFKLQPQIRAIKMNKHPVSELQEKMAKANKPLPMYTIQNSSFATGNKFVCTVQVDEITAVGSGSSKQNAKLEAAKRALEKLKNPHALSGEVTPEPQPSMVMNSQSIIDGNYIGKLNELASQHKLPTPTYSEFGVNEKNEFIIGCILLENCTRGFAPTKKLAKQNAAKEMLAILDMKSINSMKLKMPDLVDSSDKLLHKTFPDDEQIVEKFQMLTSENKPKIQQETLDLLTGYSPPPTPSLTSTIPAVSTAALWNELEKIVPVSSLEVIQKHPKHILVLNMGANGEKNVMEIGKTYDEALSNLLNKAIILAKTF